MQSPQNTLCTSTSITTSTTSSHRAPIRIRQACEPCRLRRRKCDGSFPCGQCSSHHYDCEFAKRPEFRKKSKYRRERQTGTSEDTGSTELPSSAISSNQGRRKSGSTNASKPDATQCSSTPADANVDESRTSLEDKHGSNKPIERRHLLTSRDQRRGLHGSIVFPYVVGMAVGSSSEVRRHSYAWNLNPRPIAKPTVCCSIRTMLTFRELSTYNTCFFDIINPVFELLDRDGYQERCHKYWESPDDSSADFEALIAGVFSLGSLFSEYASSSETRLFELNNSFLDRGTYNPPIQFGPDYAAAWAVRTMYLRMTVRPHLTWFASCASVQACELLALHLPLTTGTSEFRAARAKVLITALFLNALISAEVGRRRLLIGLHPAEVPAADPSSVVLRFIDILHDLEESLPPSDRLEVLRSLSELSTEHAIHGLIKADIAMQWYRRQIHAQSTTITAREAELLLSILTNGLEHAKLVLVAKQPWSHVLHTPFQTLLICMIMDTDQSLALVSDALAILRLVNSTYESDMAAEAIHIVTSFIRSLRRKKMRQATLLLLEAEPIDSGDERFASTPPRKDFGWSEAVDLSESTSWLDVCNGSGIDAIIANFYGSTN